jgi:hypothetical protein
LLIGLQYGSWFLTSMLMTGEERPTVSYASDQGTPISLVQATRGHARVPTTGRSTHPRPNARLAR